MANQNANINIKDTNFFEVGFEKIIRKFCHESIQNHVRKLLETSLIIDPSKKKFFFAGIEL